MSPSSESTGFRVESRQSIGAPLTALWDAWQRPGIRHLWLHAPGVSLRRATPPKSLRLIWNDGSSVNVTLAGQAGGRCLVTVEHSRVETAARAAALQEFWPVALERLRKRLEKRRG